MRKILINNQVDRVLALVLLLLVLLAGSAFFRYVYFEQLVSFNNEIELAKRKNAKVDSILANEKNIRISINRQKANIRRNRIFLDGRKSATAVTELQNYVKKLITTHSGANIQTIKPYPVLKYEDYSEASLEVRIKNIGHRGLRKMLYMFETNSPVLLIRELDIKFSQLRYKPLVEEKDEPKKLALTMVVSGFFRDSAGDTQ